MDDRGNYPDTRSVPAIRFSCAKVFYFPDRPLKEHFLYARAESEANGTLEYWIMDKGSTIEIIVSLSVAQTSPAANIQTFLSLLEITGVQNEDAD